MVAFHCIFFLFQFILLTSLTHRQIILDTVCGLYDQTVRQVQDLLKSHIVPAILDHDEMARGNYQGRSASRSMSLDIMSPTSPTAVVEPKSLVNQLEHFYKQFEFFGLDTGYIEQIFMQLMYYVCAIALNNLMLRKELCMWKTGMKIRYNVSCLEDWIRKKKMVRNNSNNSNRLMLSSSSSFSQTML